MCKGKVVGKWWESGGKGGACACHYESMTEQTNTIRSTNKDNGKLIGVNLVFHECCNNGQNPQVILFIGISIVCPMYKRFRFWGFFCLFLFGEENLLQNQQINI